MEKLPFKRIITHNDFDGIVSAALCSYALKVNYIFFTGPVAITRNSVSISTEDVVCDLPYPLECGMWFDHHEGNLEDLKYRHIDPETIPGRFAIKDSCARVIYEFFSLKVKFPSYIKETVEQTDIIDGFKYNSVDEWREMTPGKLVDATLKIPYDSPKKKNLYMKELVFWIRNNPLEKIVNYRPIREKLKIYEQEEKRMLDLIQKDSYFHEKDLDKEIVILDFTHHNRKPQVIKNLAFIHYPNSLAVLEVYNLFEQGKKSTNLGFSISLSVNMNCKSHSKNLGEIMRTLNIGDGHPGAAAGVVRAKSKKEMIAKKEQVIDQILTLWEKQ